jgi:hypothetical protein
VFLQATNNALAEETRCAKDGDDWCDHSMPDIVDAFALDKGGTRWLEQI